jgi:hypothetical protein
MTTLANKTGFGIGAFLAGNFAALWGFFVAPIYLVGFGLLLPYVSRGIPVMGQVIVLPIELPLIGVILATLGLLLPQDAGRGTRTACLLGLVLNAVPLALAAILWTLKAGY